MTAISFYALVRNLLTLCLELINVYALQMSVSDGQTQNMKTRILVLKMLCNYSDEEI